MRCLLYCTTVLCGLFFAARVQAQVSKIFLHPKATGNAKQSEIIDSIRFIPLEIKEGIDPGIYNYVTVATDHFLIINYTEKAIFVYSKKGAFEKKISYKKFGENLSPGYQEHLEQLVFFGPNKNYTLTPKDKVRIAQDWSNPRNKKYYKKYIIDLNDPSFTIKKDTPTQKEILGAVHLYGDHYWNGRVNTSELYKDSLDHELKIYKNNQLVKGFFPYNPVNEPRFLFSQEYVVCTEADAPGNYFVSRPFCDTVYKMIKDSLFAAYQIVLPLENSLPSSFYTRPFKNKGEQENFRRNNGWMLRQVHTFYETPRFMLFGIQYLSNHDIYVYQKQSQTGYKTKNLKTDSSQYDLALLKDFGFSRNGDRFYRSQKAGDLITFFEQHKNLAVPKELESFLKSKPNGTSTVIVEFKLKN